MVCPAYSKYYLGINKLTAREGFRALQPFGLFTVIVEFVPELWIQAIGFVLLGIAGRCQKIDRPEAHHHKPASAHIAIPIVRHLAEGFAQRFAFARTRCSSCI